MFYFDRQHPSVEFCDIRREEHELCDGRVFSVNPNTVCDFTNLPFPDESFHLVIFDPPHLKYAGADSWLARKYGRLPKDFAPLLEAGFRECFRVLKPNGTLIFKWNEQDIRVSEILKLTPEKPLLGNVAGKNGKTHWVVFFKTEGV
jgi:ubiquinone/menaquinone biosynthesis C-methylase UbiE